MRSAVGGVSLAVQKEVRASSTATDSTITAQTALTGLTITFTVVYGTWCVQGFASWISGTVNDDGFALNITDGSDTATQTSGGVIASSSTGRHSQGHVYEFISTPGTYTRKLALNRTQGTGSFSNGASLAAVTSHIRAFPIPS